MRMKCEFEAVDMGSEIIAVPVGEGADQIHGVLKLNKSALEIVEMLRNDTTTEEIINQLVAKYGNETSTLSEYVRDTIEVLKVNNLI